MELIPSKLGFATTWSFSLHGQKAQDLVRHAAIGGYLSKQSGYLSKGWEKRFFVLVPVNLLAYFESPEDTDGVLRRRYPTRSSQGPRGRRLPKRYDWHARPALCLQPAA